MTEKTIKVVTITEAEYKELQRDSAILAALHAGGVNNWDWYDASLEEFRAAEEDDE